MSGDTVAVAMCVWQRPERLPLTLDMLKAQTDTRHDVWLVVNNPALGDYVATTVAASGLRAAIHYNECNGGAYARHVLAHQVGSYDYWCFIDDDMTFPPDYVAQVKREARPDAVVGWRAFRFGRTYWDKLPIGVHEDASFVIGCGLVAPGALLADDALLGLPAERWNADDLWLSYVANHLLGYRLLKGDFAGCDEAQDGKGSYRALHEVKIRFLDDLRARGWRV